MIRASLPVVLISAAMLTGAQAQTIGAATTDLNLRSGPDPQFPVIGMLRDRQRATVIGCIEGSRWCQVSTRGRTGWVYSQYMTFSGDAVAVLQAPEIEVIPARTVVAAAPQPLPPAPIAPVAVPIPIPVPVATPYPVYAPAPVATYQPAPVVTYQQAAPTTYRAPATVVETTAVAPRNYVGRLTPAREVIYASTNLPPAYRPTNAVRSFIVGNPLDTVYLEGNLAIGTGLPVEIDLTPVPGSRFSYAYVNDYPVLVEPNSRRIVYVYR